MATEDLLSLAFNAYVADAVNDELFPPLEDFEVEDLFAGDLAGLLQQQQTAPGPIEGCCGPAAAGALPPAPAAVRDLALSPAGSLNCSSGASAPMMEHHGDTVSSKLRAGAAATPGSSSGYNAPASPQPTSAATQAAAPAAIPALPVQQGAPQQQQQNPAAQQQRPLPLSACAPALRLVTTTLAEVAGAVDAQAAINAAVAAAASCPALLAFQQLKAQQQQQQQQSNPDDSDSEDMDEGADNASGGKPNKRKAPEVDWRKIEDPAERRRQRRLAKNRVTAARSRERKKLQWADMETKIQAMETENTQLRFVLEQFARENAALKHQLLSLTAGVSGAGYPSLPLGKNNSTTTEPAALVLIATLLVVLCFMPADKAMMVGSAVPLLLLAQLLLQQKGSMDGVAVFDALFRMLAALKTTFAKSSRGLRRYMHGMLYRRHYFCGRNVLLGIGKAAQLYDAQALQPRGYPDHLDDEQMRDVSSGISLAPPGEAENAAAAAPVATAAVKAEPKELLADISADALAALDHLVALAPPAKKVAISVSEAPASAPAPEDGGLQRMPSAVASFLDSVFVKADLMVC